jgi:hypothetical protein
VEDCTTFYVEGPAVVNGQGGILNSVITDQLAGTGSSYPNSYPNSASFPTGGTQSLLAQVAVYESLGAYAQFLEPPQPPKNVDLWNLYKLTNGEIAAKWPIESQLSGGISDGGSHIGLMQVMTDPNQITAPAGMTPDPNAWNWMTNADDGVGLFSGTPPTELMTPTTRSSTLPLTKTI